MSITKTEYLIDRVKISIHLCTTEGYPDENKEEEIYYKTLHMLPKKPKDFKGFGQTWEEEVPIPNSDKKVVFIFNSYQENALGQNEESVHGPYLK